MFIFNYVKITLILRCPLFLRHCPNKPMQISVSGVQEKFTVIINADCFLPQLKVGFHRKQELVDKYLLEGSDIVLLIEHQHGLLVIY